MGLPSEAAVYSSLYLWGSSSIALDKLPYTTQLISCEGEGCILWYEVHEVMTPANVFKLINGAKLMFKTYEIFCPCGM